MSQKTNLNISPYYDDFNDDNNFYRVLFRPGRPVQARELTTLQSVLQNQIESFGSHVFKEGSMVLPGGVNYDNTSQKYIENLTGFNVLNFGVSKNFGIVQYYEIYKNFAKNYEHNKLIIFFLPSNDFGENDYNNWRGSKRYRPYYKKIENNNYETFIPNDAVKNYKSRTKKIKKIFKDYFWTSGLFINLNYNYKIYRAKKKYGKDTFSGYFDSNLDQQKAAIYFIKKIADEANIETYLVSIPRLQDFERLKKGENLQEVFWIKSLKNLTRKNKKFTFIDLIQFPTSNLESLYLKCDGHWTIAGNKWAAEIISQNLIKN